jgi:hypothetical protein
MIYERTLTGSAETRQKDITNTVIIPGFKKTVMVTTRMSRVADLVDNVDVKIRRGGVVLPAIVRDD